MSKSHALRRGRLFKAALFLGSAALAVGVGVPAGATTLPNGSNDIIVGGGSATTYTMMTALGDLFNASPGCNLTNPTKADQQLNYSCPDPQNTSGGVNGGEDGLGDGHGYNDDQSLAAGDPVNPYNDVVVEEPPIGSSFGIDELANTTFDSTPVQAIDFARSSRGPSNGRALPIGYTSSGDAPTGDPTGLNFVAYAEDAVSFLHWTEVAGKTTPSHAVTNLSVPQLTAIYNGTDTNWDQVGGTNAPIIPYTAQSGSGTEGTFATETGLTATGACLFPGVGGINSSTHVQNPNCSDYVIFENEINSIIHNPDTALSTEVPGASNLQDAIFYFSLGKFTTNCTASTATCSGVSTPGTTKKKKSILNFGSEEDTTGASPVVPSEGNIDNDTFPGSRYLYNVYSDGSGSAPVANQGTLNFVSEEGFLCKQGVGSSASDDADDSNAAPNTTYGSEIDKVITGQGFFPIKTGNVAPGVIRHFAAISDPGYSFVDPLSQGVSASTQSNCRVYTTDS